MLLKKTTCLLTLLACSFLLFAQSVPVDDQRLALQYSFISTSQNRIFNSSSLQPFFKKLSALKDSSRKTVNIVHIGDSHIQADFLSGVVRNKFQDHFGNAGRGLVFPYQLAQSNAPSDISGKSDRRWQFNRVAHPEIPAEPGISGFVLETDHPGSGFSLGLKGMQTSAGEEFNRIKLFASPGTKWEVTTNTRYEVDFADSAIFHEILLQESASGSLFTTWFTGLKSSFYGVSLENSRPGIIYHTIGVNGARYDHYNRATLFWKQLGVLDADLYIISLGTNEAQAASIKPADLKSQISILVGKLKEVSPDAAIIITTAPDSYKRGRSNLALKSVNETIALFCDEKSIPIWNLYKATNGFGSAYNWNRRKLMSRDRIHYTADGYRLQGSLLFNAIAKAYNDFLSVKN